MNIHHFDEFTSNPSAFANKFYALWRQIAAHYAKSPDDVAFELLNEPKDAATTVVLNPIYAEAIRVIRETNPRRVIFVGPGKWNQVSELPNLRLPDKDQNLIVTVHCYDPFNFTHQGATWTSSDVKGLKGIVFPGPPSRPFVPDPDRRSGRCERKNELRFSNRFAQLSSGEILPSKSTAKPQDGSKAGSNRDHVLHSHVFVRTLQPTGHPH